jgi:hypothetical protein
MKSDKILVVIVATTAPTQILSVRQQEAAVQNTTMTNHTIPPTENKTMTNQTQGGGAIVAATANLTQADQ